MKNKITLSVLALCCAGRLAQAQEFPGGIHIGSYAADGGIKPIMFGDTGCPTCVWIGEFLADDTMWLNAARFTFQNGNVGIGTATPAAKLDVIDGYLRARDGANTPPTSGQGLEMVSTGGHGYLQSFNRDTPRYNSLNVNGAPLLLNYESGANVGIGAAFPAAKLHVVTPGGVGVFSGDLAPFGQAEFESNISTPHTHAWFAENGVAVFGVTAGGQGYFAGQVKATTLLLTSDRNAKSNFRSVDSREVLKKVASLPLSTWHYTNAPGIRHIGPMAQDFKAAFAELGEDDKHIATVDADGVAFASIQALFEMVQEKDSAIAALQSQVSALKTELAGVKDNIADRLAALENAIPKNIQQASFRPEAAR